MRRLVAFGWLSLSALIALSACGSSNKDPGASAGAAGTGTHTGGGIGIATGGQSNGTASGGTALGFGGTGNSSGGSGSIDTCAETAQMGKLVPLDIYIMLDVSGSMLDPTTDAANAPSKWSAVRSALQAFLADPGSDGLGVGIQYFPLADPTVPATCNSDAQCGAAHGPCFLKFCQNAGPGYFQCSTAAECVTDAGENLGPCVPLTYCWPPSQAAATVQPCHNVSECPVVPGALCVPFNECSGNTDYSCPTAGVSCGTAMGMQLGTCRAFSPDSVCVHNVQCAATAYAEPAVDIAPLPGAASAVVASINAADPAGNTPTAPALTGALSKARAWATAHPDHTVVALLATDGLPTECIAAPATDPSGITGVRGAAAAGLSGMPSVSTFVIGVFGPDDTGAQQNLNQIAVAGGTKAAFMVDTTGDVTAQFLAALNQIRESKLACEYLVPDPPTGSNLDFNLVNVDFTNGASKERILKVSAASACDSAAGGWYYDVEPSAASTPTKIMICPATCSRFQSTQSGAVQIALGCKTQIR